MSRNQNRIEGNYSIVSVSRGINALADFNNTNQAIAFAMFKGCSVEVVEGHYFGKTEISLRLSGLNSAYVARNLAESYNQDTHINVSGGCAYLIDSATSEVITVWTEQHGGLSDGDCGTFLSNGHSFHFS